MKYMFGADPETFILAYPGERDECIIPAELFFPGTTKGKCQNFGAGGVHCDNVMLEFNPNPGDHFFNVIENLTILQEEVNNVIHERANHNLVRAYVKALNIDLNRYDGQVYYSAAPVAYANINPIQQEYLKLNTKSFKEFGCTPDYNTYLRDVNPPVDLPDKRRVAGGHIMISAQDERLDNPAVVMCAVKWMDVLLMPKLMFGWQPGEERYAYNRIRRQYYGRAGSFRPKQFPNGSYGIEYRVPGPDWMNLRDEKLIDSIEFAMIEAVERGFHLLDPQVSNELIDQAINLMDHEALCELKEMQW